MEADSLKDKEILIIEDSRVSRSVLERVISQAGGNMHVFSAVDDPDQIFDNYYDIAIMDIMVNDFNTIDIIPQLKEQNPNLRIIIQTALPDLLNKRPEIQQMVDFLIEKPATAEKISRVIEQCIYRPLKGKHALIVEDARVSRQALVRIIHRLGGTPYAYTDLNEQNTLLAQKYDLAILDLLLGSETSIPLIPELRKRNPEIFIFIVSAMPSILHNHPDVMAELAYIFQKPVSDRLLEKNLILAFEQPYSDRRKSPRKHGLSHCWVARFDKELNKPELFESPYLADVSNSGMSFHSFMQYDVADEVIIWILAHKSPHQEKILELRGVVRWMKKLQGDESQSMNSFGVEFNREASPSFTEWQTIVTRLIEK